MENLGDLAQGLALLGKYLGAGLCMGLGAIGPGMGEGNIGAHAMDAMARQPEMVGTITTRMLLADAVAETTGIYSLLIAFMILLVV
ncbi:MULTISPECIES: F0F1 ATP synthase subunit C [unclassified Thermotoga]|uniref:F0F1 ATP synthase subunit C n=1 Tax=unclassified Thermotoga TaxID=2631113 RepID=UPI000C758AE4|nr:MULTISPECIES: F0F1 ATP synthase subunit C [unclassified Thermotoga]MCD6552008.1 F0F1 ATP synthase subunit C [Thermotoga sp.]PLV60266.1 ATP F0F1 synthase subunit C [Thermotoga sp. KOL6]